MRPHPRERLAFGLTVLTGTALRLFRLGTDSLWYDETVSVALAGSPLTELIRHTAGDIHPPGYYALLRGWLLLAGYPDGHADPHGNGLEFAAGFLSLFAGILLIALAYALAKRVTADPRVPLIAASVVALSPYNIWYGQEVRMYTLGAVLGAVALYALLQVDAGNQPAGDGWLKPMGGGQRTRWWAAYAVAAAAGMYTLYYFAFLLIPLNLWALARTLRGKSHHHTLQLTLRPSNLSAWLLANLGAALLYAPWIPVAWRQAVNPPVPPWRAAPDLLAALWESWTALSLGQSAPAWLWPALLLTAALYAWGWAASTNRCEPRRQQSNTLDTRSAPRATPAVLIPVTTFAPLALILAVSLVTPLYHVRYLFTFSPPFYVVLAAGLARLLRRSLTAAGVAALVWLAATGVTLHAFWADPLHRADDHRAAVRQLQAHWRPGDVVLVNAGWSYTALTTYWDGPIAGRTRLTDNLPVPRPDDALVLVTTGHVEGEPGLGWADPRSDFYALPADVGARRIAELFQQFDRVWHYRIYDTVNDPDGQLRAWLYASGRLFEDLAFSGEANLRVQGLLPLDTRASEPGWPSAAFGPDLTVRAGPLPGQVASGETLYATLAWQPSAPVADFATSVRLVAPDGAAWAQGADERPAGTAYPASQWPVLEMVRQTAVLPVPPGTPPGPYAVELVVYDPATGQPWPATAGDLALTANGVRLGEVTVARPDPPPAPLPALAGFGPLALVEASSPAGSVAPGARVPVELLWQAAGAPGEPLVVVVQLQDSGGRIVSGLEAQPLNGAYPTQAWVAGELVRDRHTLGLPPDLPAGKYRLIVGLYRARDQQRLETRSGLFGGSDHWVIRTIAVR